MREKINEGDSKLAKIATEESSSWDYVGALNVFEAMIKIAGGATYNESDYPNSTFKSNYHTPSD